MKANIHPTNHTITVKCVCGNTFETTSTESEIEVDICAACHPFFTGDMRLVDREGRVDRFMKQMQRAQEMTATRQTVQSDDTEASEDKKSNDTKSYKEVLEEQKQAL